MMDPEPETLETLITTPASAVYGTAFAMGIDFEAWRRRHEHETVPTLAIIRVTRVTKRRGS